ncbi:MAG: DUF2141 domain-containing protein [Gammaproteobacteria bacterium]
MRRTAAALLAATLCAGGTTAAGEDLLDLFEAVDEAPAPAAPAASVTDPRAQALLEALAIVTVHVDGVADDRGVVRVLLYDEAEAYVAGDAARAVGYAEVPATAGRLDVSLRAAGTPPYAVFAFHDANGDEQLDGGARPTEGYGFSGGVDWLQPPFERAAQVTVEGTVRLLYPERTPRR